MDEDGDEKIFAAFGDLSIRIPGIYRLLFTLFEYTQEGVIKLGDILSDPFEVFQAKKFLGMQVSTPLCQLLAGQGMKLRVRKDARFRYHTRQRTQSSPKRENLTDDMQSEGSSLVEDDQENNNDVVSTHSYPRPRPYSYAKHHSGSSRDLPPNFIAYPPLTLQLGQPEAAANDRFSENISIVPRIRDNTCDFAHNYNDAYHTRPKMPLPPDLNTPMALSRPPVSHLRSTVRPSSYSTVATGKNETSQSSSTLPSITEFLKSTDSLRHSDRVSISATRPGSLPSLNGPFPGPLPMPLQMPSPHSTWRQTPSTDQFNQHGVHRFSPYDRLLPRPSAS